MQAKIGIDAAILHHQEAVVGVAGVEQCGVHDTAGCDAEQNQRVSISFARRIMSRSVP